MQDGPAAQHRAASALQGTARCHRGSRGAPEERPAWRARRVAVAEARVRAARRPPGCSPDMPSSSPRGAVARVPPHLTRPPISQQGPLLSTEWQLVRGYHRDLTSTEELNARAPARGCRVLGTASVQGTAWPGTRPPRGQSPRPAACGSVVGGHTGMHAAGAPDGQPGWTPETRSRPPLPATWLEACVGLRPRQGLRNASRGYARWLTSVL